jgi:iron complex outermembrane receptor protein
MNLKKRRSVAALLIGTTALVLPAIAYAQATSSPAAATSVQEVVVTGTLFRTKTETASPTTVITATELQKEGITTASDAIRSISADNSGTVPTAFGIGFAVGSSGVALRGLTVNSTLVLIDGLRTANYGLADDGERGFVDLNTIPDSIIDHVDVVKDGASATYGADAIGGVVNIIMKPTFQGEYADAEVGTSQHGGGTMGRFAGTVGYGDLDTDHFNAYFNVEFQHDDSIRVGQRGYPFNTDDYSGLGGVNNLAGQPGNFSGSIYGSVSDAVTGGPTQILAPGGCGPKGTLHTANQNGDGNANVFCYQNATLYGDDQPEQTRFGFYGRFTVQLNPNTTAYLNTSYYQNRVRVDTASNQIQTTVPVNTDAITIPAVFTAGPNAGQLNPNNPFAALGDPANINYLFGDIPAYTLEVNHVIREVADLKTSDWGWDFDLSGAISHTWLDSTDAGFINYNQLIADINDGAYSFINPSSNSAAVRQALAPNLVKTSTTDEDMIQAIGSRDVFDLPGGPLKVALGASFRYEAADDPDLNPNLAAQGLGIAHTVGNRTVASAFGELNAPVLSTVNVDFAGRFDHYSDFGDNFSPKVEVKWTPIQQLALRGTWSLGFRAPSFSENGSSASEGFTQYTANADAGFEAAHHNDEYVENAYNLAELASANPKIKPEKSQSFTFGGIIQPWSNFSVSLDYYYIKKTQVIVQASPSTALAAYYAAGGGAAGLAAVPAGYTITLDAPDPLYPNAPARPVVVGASYINANSIVTDGLDVEVKYNYKLPYDVRFSSDFNVTDMFEFKYSQPGSPTVDYVGTQSPYILSSGAGTPQWHANWVNSFTKGPATVAVTVDYVSGLKADVLDIEPGCAATAFYGVSSNCNVGSFTDVDLYGSYDITPKITIYGDIDDLLDAKPPLDVLDYAGVNYNPTYDQAGIVGRYFKIGLKARF